jgi:hypothetical protein
METVKAIILHRLSGPLASVLLLFVSLPRLRLLLGFRLPCLGPLSSTLGKCQPVGESRDGLRACRSGDSSMDEKEVYSREGSA